MERRDAPMRSLPAPTVWAYLRRLVRKWFFTIVFIFDILGIFLLPNVNIYLPLWVYFAIFVICFLGANYGVYKDLVGEAQAAADDYERVLIVQRETILALENKWPKLKLGFAVGDDLVTSLEMRVQRVPPESDLDQLVANEQDALRQAYNEYDVGHAKNTGIPVEDVVRSVLATAAFLAKPKKSAKDYEQECDEYLDRYRSYLRYSKKHMYFEARFRRVGFVLENGGTTPASHIVFDVTFPAGFRFPSEDDIRWLELDELEPFGRPDRPEVFLDLSPLLGEFPQILHMPQIGPLLPTHQDFVEPSLRGPIITNKGDKTTVRFEADRLGHQLQEHKFSEVGFFVPEEVAQQSYTLPYRIYASELPEAMEGTLKLVFREEDDY